jgi:hypothetical protein
MSNADGYRDKAAKCILVAEDCISLASRLALMEMAHAWLRLAEQAEKNGHHLDLTYKTPSLRPVVAQ